MMNLTDSSGPEHGVHPDPARRPGGLLSGAGSRESMLLRERQGRGVIMHMHTFCMEETIRKHKVKLVIFPLDFTTTG